MKLLKITVKLIFILILMICFIDLLDINNTTSIPT